MIGFKTGIKVDFSIHAFDRPPDLPGLYFICGKRNKALADKITAKKIPLFNNYLLLYIGISKKSIYGRDYKSHFNGTARRSTLRKSLGSLFEWQDYRVYDTKNIRKYKFDDAHEKLLTRWMHDNLVLYYWTHLERDLDELEMMLIQKYSPPLNILKAPKDKNTEFRLKLKRLRN